MRLEVVMLPRVDLNIQYSKLSLRDNIKLIKNVTTVFLDGEIIFGGLGVDSFQIPEKDSGLQFYCLDNPCTPTTRPITPDLPFAVHEFEINEDEIEETLTIYMKKSNRIDLHKIENIIGNEKIVKIYLSEQCWLYMNKESILKDEEAHEYFININLFHFRIMSINN